jgi:hypothetical protein
MKTVAIPPCPSTPFELEPSYLGDRPCYSVAEAERRRGVQDRYSAVRAWHSMKEELERDGYAVTVER